MKDKINEASTFISFTFQLSLSCPVPFFLNFILFNFTILYWFCQISKLICHRYICVPHPEPSSFIPPHTITLGHPSAWAPGIQYHASNLDWRLVSYMILYITYIIVKVLFHVKQRHIIFSLFNMQTNTGLMHFIIQTPLIFLYK